MKNERTFFLLLIFATVLAVFRVPAALAESSDGSSAPAQPASKSFVLRPYKPLYVLATYDWDLSRRGAGLQDYELKFQYSFKIPIFSSASGSREFAFGFTQVSYWQAFNFGISAPFRETNYAPEFMYSMEHRTTALGLEKVGTVLAVIHESNGKGVPDSRSWNRLYAAVKLDWGNFVLGVKPWYRIPERPKSSPTDARGDDNPDILRYMGYGELTAEFRTGTSRIIITARNNLRSSPNYGAVQLDVILPIKNEVKFYVQYFNGYGESLIDYNRYNERIGAGILVASWL